MARPTGPTSVADTNSNASGSDAITRIELDATAANKHVTGTKQSSNSKLKTHRERGLKERLIRILSKYPAKMQPRAQRIAVPAPGK